LPPLQPAVTRITPCAHAKYFLSQRALQVHSSTSRNLVPGISSGFFPLLGQRERDLPVPAERPLSSGSKEIILPLYAAPLCLLEHWVQFWAPQYKRDMDILE